MADTLQHSQANVPTFYVGNLLPITPCVGWPEPSERHLAAIRQPRCTRPAFRPCGVEGR